MRIIDLQSWPRRQHFELFTTFNHPHFSLCANVDLTRFYPGVKADGCSFTAAVAYTIARSANTIPEFRQRIREGSVVEHEVVHPSFTILAEDERFGFCTVSYDQDFHAFAQRAARCIAEVKAQPTLRDRPGADDLLFMSVIPWVSFTSVEHPMRLHPADSIPRFAWGKYFKEGKRLKMPLAAQGHHALLDGLHLGRFFETIQSLLDQPEIIFTETERVASG